MKLALLILYFGVMVGIGLYCRKHTSGINGFVLGGRSVGPWAHCLCLWHILLFRCGLCGYAGQFGWKYGIAATWAGIGNAILGSLLAWAVLGRRTRILTQHYNSATMPQFLSAISEQVFEDRRLRHRLCLSDSLHGLPVQWSLPAFRHGVPHGLHRLHHSDGGPYRYLCDRRRLYGHCHQ